MLNTFCDLTNNNFYVKYTGNNIHNNDELPNDVVVEENNNVVILQMFGGV